MTLEAKNSFYFLKCLKKYIFFVFLFVLYLFMAASDLRCCTWALVVASGGYFSLRCAGFSLWWLLLLWNMGSIQACGLNCPLACEIFPTRGQTHVPRIGRWVLNYWITREVPEYFVPCEKYLIFKYWCLQSLIGIQTCPSSDVSSKAML